MRRRQAGSSSESCLSVAGINQHNILITHAITRSKGVQTYQKKCRNSSSIKKTTSRQRRSAETAATPSKQPASNVNIKTRTFSELHTPQKEKKNTFIFSTLSKKYVIDAVDCYTFLLLFPVVVSQQTKS